MDTAMRGLVPDMGDGVGLAGLSSMGLLATRYSTRPSATCEHVSAVRTHTSGGMLAVGLAATGVNCAGDSMASALMSAWWKSSAS